MYTWLKPSCHRIIYAVTLSVAINAIMLSCFGTLCEPMLAVIGSR